MLQVAQTCQLALQRIAFFDGPEGRAFRSESRYLSVDPAPPAEPSTSTGALKASLLDETAPIFDRYRALFALRDRGAHFKPFKLIKLSKPHTPY